MAKEQTIYLVEDDSSIRELVVYTLNNSGFSACGFENGSAFWQAIQKEKPSLVLLDIMLPGEDGLKILTDIRGKSSYKDMPVIMLTAKSTEYDRVVGLDKGADDYIVKPFGMMELISRIKAVLRRSAENSGSDELRAGDILLDAARHSISVGGRQVALTLKEFELLRFLMENAGMVLSRDRILERIWGYDFDGETRTVDVHVRTLRTKLGEAGSMVETVRGVGYKFRGD